MRKVERTFTPANTLYRESAPETTKEPFCPFNHDFCRNPARIRAVFDTSVAAAKSMNTTRLQPSLAKIRAGKLGLKVDVQEAKQLTWRAIQTRPPVVLTAGPSSPPRTPRRPALEYPSAERLYLINAQNALDRKDQIEASHWFACAELERKHSEKEANEKEAASNSHVRDNPASPFSTDQHAARLWRTTSSRQQLSCSHEDFVNKPEVSDGSIPIVLECNVVTSPGVIKNDVPIDVAEDELMSDTLTKPNCRERRSGTKPRIRGRAATTQPRPHTSMRQDTENVMLSPSPLNQYVQESVIGIDLCDPMLVTSVDHLRPRKKKRFLRCNTAIPS